MGRSGKTLSLAAIMKGRRFSWVSSGPGGETKFTECGADGRPVIDVSKDLVPNPDSATHGKGRP